MKLYNKSQRNFQLSNETIIKPNDLFEVDDKVGKKLLELYPGEILEAGAAVPADKKDNEELKKVKAELEEIKKQLEALTTDKAKVDAELEEAKKQIETLTADKAKVDAELVKLKK
jgi:septal ring factor EnvC (AmiA/AmiB activator)